jgi:hypothetical protein
MTCTTRKWNGRWLAHCAFQDEATESFHVLTSRDANPLSLGDDAPIASLHLKRTDGDDQAALIIEGIDIHRKSDRRTRLGTALYEHAVQIACDEGRVLASDDMRSPFAEAFWRKQKAKGRATCVPGEGTLYKGPVNRLRRQWEKGEIETHEYEAIVAKLPQPEGNTWPCSHYEITAPCSTRSLARLKRRKR